MSLIVSTLIAVLQQGTWLEADYQSCACDGMEIERVLPSGARADCLSETYAIEVESYSDWAEGIGQSLHYSAQSGLLPALILFCETAEEQCFKEDLRLRETIAAFGLPIAVFDVSEFNCSPPHDIE